MGELADRLTLSSPGTGKQLACCFLELVFFCFKLTTFCFGSAGIDLKRLYLPISKD
jgi:hypothetical protein